MLFMKINSQITFDGCVYDPKTVYMIAVGYESNGLSFGDKFLIVQGLFRLFMCLN